MTNPLGTDLLNAQMVNVRDRSSSRLHQGSQSPSPHDKVHSRGVITIGTVITGTILVMMCMKVDTSMGFPWPVWWMGL